MATSPSPFDSIAAEFRTIFAELGKSELDVRGTTEMEDFKDEEIRKFAPRWIWGGRIYPMIADEMRRIELYVVSGDEKIARRFHQAGTRAGASIPNRIRDSVKDLQATTAFAWWMAAVWDFSTIEPDVSKGWSPERPEECGDPGVFWPDPIAASLSAIEAAGLIGPDPAHSTAMQGEWSVPMSKTEFARRILQKSDARARDVKPIWVQYDKQQVGENTWTFRLDALPPATRKKLEGGKP